MKLQDMQNEVKRFTRIQKILISFICVLLLAGIITVATGPNMISKLGYDAFTMIRYSVIDHPFEVISDWQKDLSSLRSVQKENDDLKKIISSQDMQGAIVKEQKRQIKEMEALMNFDSNAAYQKIYASIVYRDMNTWSNTITVNKGENDGITVDMAVISSKGLIGKVSEVNKTTCKVKLLSNEGNDVNVSVKIELDDKTTTDGILESYDLKSGKYNVQVFDSNADIKKGMRIITSGNGGVFPSGILIGKANKVTQLYNAKGKIVTVKPSVDFNDFDFVAILKVN